MAGNFSDWSPYSNYVQAGLVDGRYATAGFTMLAAGPPRHTGLPPADPVEKRAGNRGRPP